MANVVRLRVFGGRDDDVRSAFSWSCAILRKPAARLFRLLAAHPGPDMSADSAAGLAGADVPGWTPRASFAEDVRRFSSGPAWVTEWQYPAARELLVERADLLVWLDLPRAPAMR